MGMRAQLSVEMLVILVVVLALAVLVAKALTGSASKAAGEIENKTGEVINISNAALAKGGPGDSCRADGDCASRSCDSYTKTCSG